MVGTHIVMLLTKPIYFPFTEILHFYKQSFEHYMLFSVLSACLKLDDVTGRGISTSVL